jgi:hypothetical protein
MENGLTFRFEGSDIQELVTDSGTKYVHVTFYLELLEPDKKKVIMKAIMEGFSATATRTGSKGGCPVPPCALAPSTAADPECIRLGDEIAGRQ